MDPSQPALVFVYNADSGLLNALLDLGHKVVSPRTYACRLCALTYSPLGMRRQWRTFTEQLERPVTFLHADELAERYGLKGVALPAVFEEKGSQLELLLTREAINRCGSLADLEGLLTRSLNRTGAPQA
ncbi:MAG: hypothetical protein AVDCRST_MAG86-2154 [uncultured Truepera sp.]|uniref:GTPase n=1 Tax=uncultured Truepera sp. TaxID=543023 RepID=A0A6J4VCW5_9DEIN|nr:MAG: hypothetical protein AVDCRST_MAG86-2154 [uncultured Truepera sp.]